MGEIASAYVRIRPQMTGFKSEVESGVRGAFSNVGKIVGLSFGLVAVGDLFKGAIESAETYQAALRGTDVAIQHTGGNILAYRGEIDRLVESAARLGFTNEDVQAGFQRLTLVSGNASDAVKYMGLVEDLARGRGIDLSSAATAVGRAIDGKTAALQKYGVVAKKGETIEQLLAHATQVWGGQAEAATTTQLRLHATLHNVVEEIGSVMLPTFEKAVNAIEHWINQAKNQKKIEDDVREATHLATTAFDKARAAIHAIDGVTGSFTNTLKILLALKVASVLSSWGNNFYKVAGAEATASAEAKGLMGWLAGLARIGPIIIPVVIAYSIMKYGAKNVFSAAGGGGIDATLGPGISPDQTVTVNGRSFPIGTSAAQAALRGAGFKGPLNSAVQQAQAAIAVAKKSGVANPSQATSLTSSAMDKINAIAKQIADSGHIGVPKVSVPSMLPPSYGSPSGGGGGKGGANAAAAIDAARTSLEQSFKKLAADAAKLGGDLSKKMKQSLAGLHTEIKDIGSKADVTKARENLRELQTEISHQLAALKLKISEMRAFDALKQQAAKLGTDVTPQIKQQMAAIRDEIGKVSTPQQIASIRARMATVKKEIAAQLTAIKNQISADKSTFDGVWSEMVSGIDAAFDKATAAAIKAMQVMVNTVNGSFLFGGAITQTPTEIALATLQAAHDAAANAQTLSDAQDKLAADQLENSGATADQILADKKSVADAEYTITVATMQKQANLERTAADQQLNDAQSAYQDQRNLEKQAMDDRLAILKAGVDSGNVAAQAAMSQLNDILSGAGVDIAGSAGVLAGTYYSSLADGLSPVFDLLKQLQDAMRQVGLLPGGPNIAPPSLTLPHGLGGNGPTGPLPFDMNAFADAVRAGVKGVEDELKKKQEPPVVNVDGGADTKAKVSFR